MFLEENVMKIGCHVSFNADQVNRMYLTATSEDFFNTYKKIKNEVETEKVENPDYTLLEEIMQMLYHEYDFNPIKCFSGDIVFSEESI